MNDIDRLLDEAGDRWRASQPPASTIDPSALFRARRPGVVLSVVAAVTTMALVVAIVLSWQTGLIWPDLVGHGPMTSSDANQVGGVVTCPPTRPEPEFVPPSPYPPLPVGEASGLRWFGADALWTMLDREGEVWSASQLPHGPDGLTQKTWWFSAEWPGTAREPEPAIFVVGRRLGFADTFTAGPGTNAGSSDFGEAMLVGVTIPTPGCWELTGYYRGAELSYVVWIKDD